MNIEYRVLCGSFKSRVCKKLIQASTKAARWSDWKRQDAYIEWRYESETAWRDYATFRDGFQVGGHQ